MWTTAAWLWETRWWPVNTLGTQVGTDRRVGYDLRADYGKYLDSYVDHNKSGRSDWSRQVAVEG